jgi:D-alanyl-D-alanine carboxypeptidase
MKKTIKICLTLILTAVFLTAPFSSFALEDPEFVNVAAAYLYNIETDTILYTYNENNVLYPTSTVKIMTGIIAIEELGHDLNREITITDAMIKGVMGQNIQLKKGEILTVENLINALLVGGANDAAQALAVTISGSVEGFVAKMNARAKELGAENTFYMNPSGMHNDSMVTTAYDTFLIARHAYGLGLFMEITSNPKYVIGEPSSSSYRTINNRNYMIARNVDLRYYYPLAAGMNAGSTPEGGACVVTTASNEGLTYLCVVMGAENIKGDEAIYSYQTARTLLNWAFENYGYREILSSSEIVCEIPVSLSASVDHVTLVPSEPLSVFLPIDVDIKNEITFSHKTISERLDAPIEAGQTAGMITIIYKDKILGNIDLITTSSISRSEFLFILARIRTFTGSRFFKATIVAVIVLSILYVIIQSIRRQRGKKKRNYYM